MQVRFSSPPVFGMAVNAARANAVLHAKGLPGIGDTFPTDKTFSVDDLQRFCQAVGNGMNVNHLAGLNANLATNDRAAAKAASHQSYTIPGSFVMTQITPTFIGLFKGKTSQPIFPIYKEQQAKWIKPVSTGETVHTRVTVDNIGFEPKGDGYVHLNYGLATQILKHHPQKHASGQEDPAVLGKAKVVIRRPVSADDAQIEGAIQALSVSA